MRHFGITKYVFDEKLDFKRKLEFKKKIYEKSKRREIKIRGSDSSLDSSLKTMLTPENRNNRL